MESGNVPPSVDVLTMIKASAGPTLAAVAGLLVRWSDDHRRGDVLTWRRAAIELPACTGFGVIAGGAAAWIGAPVEATWAIAALLAHLGTGGMVQLLLLIRRS